MGGEKEKSREKAMGVEQRNWKMREGLKTGQNEKKIEGGSICFVAEANC